MQLLGEGGTAALAAGVGVPSHLSGAVERHAALAAALPLTSKGRRLRAVLDVTGGTGLLLGPALMDLLDVDFTVINPAMGPGGSFPRVAEPTSENLADLCSEVLRTGSDVGFAFDPDGDRLALVDDRGRAVGEEYTVALALDHVLSHRPGPAVVNLSTSMLSEDAAARHSCTVFRSPVGEVNVVEEMERRGASIGGEGNGGVIDTSCHPGRDSAVAMAYTVSLLRERGIRLSGWIDGFRPYTLVKRKVQTDLPFEIIERSLEDAFGTPDDSRDGAWFRRPGGWMHVRPSGTEPVVRFIAENLEPCVVETDYRSFERIVNPRCAE
jgi:phosphomannomutase